MFGNGGFAGEAVESGPEVESRETGLSKGFATVRTDTGHLAAKEPLATFASKQRNKIDDHGYRALHETITLAKKVVATFYARAADYSYWQGCSTGGRQGIMAASRFPEDFGGIAAAAPTLPGVAHCSGGYGPDQIDAMTPLIEWVESGKTPERLGAQKKVGDFLKYNRAICICVYPQATVYQGGDPEQPRNYACVLPMGGKP